MALIFPSNAQITELKKSKKLDEALDVYAQTIVQLKDTKTVAQWCREYLSNPTVSQHSALRKAVFYLTVHERILVDSPVETVWDFISRFGPRNESACIAYLDAAPRSIPLKFGRLLLYFAELGRPKGLANDVFEQCVTVVLSSAQVYDAVVTQEWTKSLRKFRTNDASIILEVVQNLDRSGPCWTLVTLFPQLSPSKAIVLLRRSQLSLEELTQRILDNPNYIDEALKETPKSQRKKFVVLDDKVRQAKEDALREHNKQHFKFDFVSLEDMDPEPEDDGPSQPELSEADKILASQEELLWSYWQSNRGVFDRASRKSEPRKQLCAKLKWTDEQVEGWGRVIGQKGRSELASDEVQTYAPSLRPIDAEQKPKKTESPKPGNAKPGNTKPGNTKPDAKKPESAKPENAKAENKKKKSHNARPKNSGKKNHSRPE